MTTADVIAMLKRACASAGTARAWAEQNKVSQTYVSDVLRGKKDPGEAICRALGIVAEKTYRRVQK